jgi:hypothetical protein
MNIEFAQQALMDRHAEVELYQFNIDNYKKAIEEIDQYYSERRGMKEFRDSLKDLLESSETEQLKAIIIRDVIAKQLAEETEQ